MGPEVDGINVDGMITTANGDVLLSSVQDVRSTAAIDSTNGDIGIVATGSIQQENSGDIATAGDVLIDAGAAWTMSSDATISGNNVLGQAAGNLALGRITATTRGRWMLAAISQMPTGHC